MRDFFARWLTRRPRCPGVVAWGIWIPGEESISQTLSGEGAEAQHQAIWNEIADALHQMPQHHASTDQMRWVFAQRVIHASLRSDGVCLVILVERGSEEAGRACIEKALADFKGLRVPASAR